MNRIALALSAFLFLFLSCGPASASYLPGSVFLQRIMLYGVGANTTITIPAGASIEKVVIVNNTVNPVLGGVKIGTTAGAADVVLALTIGGSAFAEVAPTALLRTAFSFSTDQTLYVQSVVGWNGTNVNIMLIYAQAL